MHFLHILIATIILTCFSCFWDEQKSLSPDEKLNSLLNQAELHVKTKGFPKEYASINNKDTLESKVFYDCSINKSYATVFMVLTEMCLKERKATDTSSSEMQTKFENDSSYLSIIKLKMKEINEQFIAKGDPSVLDAVIRIEKTKLLMCEMDRICTLDTKAERAE